MNLDDESLLSAYLDDELDPADRLAVEWSVESSPPLADQLRSLAIARDAVAGLGRPALPFDLAPAITAHLAADRRRARLQAPARPGRVALAVAGLSAMAASLLFALLLLHRATHDRLDLAEVPQQNHEVDAPRNHPVPDSDTNPTTRLPIVPNVAIPSPGQDHGPSLVERESADQVREREDRLKITRMLENPEVRVILITTDVIDASGQIHNLIHDDARATPDFGRITLRTGLVVDPKQPGSAEVFVVSINEGGRESFVSRLREKFHELTEEDENQVPDLVTQLTEVGQVAIYQGTRASTLVPAPVDPRPFAVRTDPGSGRDRFSDQRTGSLVASDPPRHPNDRTPVDANVFVGPPPRLKPGEPVTLVVWVTRPGRH